MHRERIQKQPSTKPERHLEILPLDPRDPEILHAKELIEEQQPPRGRAA